MIELDECENRLLQAALKAMGSAYVLWGIKVGAAVVAEDGCVYEGCNVESWVSGLGTCAERCAINHAVLHGNRCIKEIAVVMDAKNDAEPRPCGACLQYIYDFAQSARLKIVMAKAEKGKILLEKVRIKTIEELLPLAYRK
ncbi:MAG: cytidine deaminase [Candidatus Bathyarchaeota archaeon]|nr:cytidine deaminase [Candidatus Bathyarchaeota archaeon]